MKKFFDGLKMFMLFLFIVFIGPIVGILFKTVP